VFLLVLIGIVSLVFCDPELQITGLTPNPDPAVSGTNITFTLNFVNIDNATIGTPNGITVAIGLDRTTFQFFQMVNPVSVMASCNIIPNPVLCTVPDVIIAPGQTASAIFRLIPLGTAVGSSVDTQVTVSAINITGPGTSDTLAATSNIIAPAGTVDLQVSMKELSSNPLVIGSNGQNTQIITNTTVVNNGPDNSTTTFCTITLPYASAFAIVSSTRGTCSHTTGTPDYRCPLGTLAPGVSATISVLMGLISTSSAGVVSTTAVCTADQNESTPNDNTASVQTTLQDPATDSSGTALSSWLSFY